MKHTSNLVDNLIIGKDPHRVHKRFCSLKVAVMVEYLFQIVPQAISPLTWQKPTLAVIQPKVKAIRLTILQLEEMIQMGMV